MSPNEIRDRASSIAAGCGRRGWNSYDAAPVLAPVIEDALALALWAAAQGYVVEEFVPLHSGGCRVVWSSRGAKTVADVETRP